jgi:hypothetical protein
MLLAGCYSLILSAQIPAESVFFAQPSVVNLAADSLSLGKHP